MREYVSPEFYVMEFEENEYVAACGKNPNSSESPSLTGNCNWGTGLIKVVLNLINGQPNLPTIGGAGMGATIYYNKVNDEIDSNPFDGSSGGTLYRTSETEYVWGGAIDDLAHQSQTVTGNNYHVDGEYGTNNGALYECTDPTHAHVTENHHHFSNIQIHNPS